MYLLTDICFLCLANNTNIKSVSLKDEDGLTVTEKLQYVLSELTYFKQEPKNICTSCLKDLNYLYKFKQKCLKNVAHLTEYFKKENNNATETNHQIEIKQEVTNTSQDIQTQKNVQKSVNATRKRDINSTDSSSDEEAQNFQEVFIKQEFGDLHHEEDIKCDPLFEEELHTEHNLEEELVKQTSTADTSESQQTPKTASDIFPERSKKNYKIVYNTFNEWRNTNNVTTFEEDTVLKYFSEIAPKYKSTTLWTHFSILKTILKFEYKTDIESYTKVRALLKRQSELYQPKKSESFTGGQINKFINEAPNNKYLVTKVALIMGVTGACRASELYSMKIEDLKFFAGCVQVFIPHTKSKYPRNFVITDNFYQIVKTYRDLRPSNAPSNAFFLNFQKGKCTKQVIGINKFGAMGKEIAKFLKLDNPDRYTGHCLRRSATVNTTGAFRPREWKFADGYIVENMDGSVKVVQQSHVDNSHFSNANSSNSNSYITLDVTTT